MHRIFAGNRTYCGRVDVPLATSGDDEIVTCYRCLAEMQKDREVALAQQAQEAALRAQCLPFDGKVMRHRVRTNEFGRVVVEDDCVIVGPVYVKGWKPGTVIASSWNWGFDIALEWLRDADEVRPDEG